MKTQLLEDIGENNSLPVIPPAISPPAHVNEPEPQPAAAPKADKWNAGPWRQRQGVAVEQPTNEPVFAPPPPPAPAPAPEPQMHTFDPDPLAESWAIANPDTGPTWLERWGRRAAAVSASVAALVLAAGGAAWVYNETKTDQALAVASQAMDDPVPAYVRSTPIAEVPPIDIQPSELAPLDSDFYADVPDFDPTPVAAKRPRSRVRTIAAAPRRPAPRRPAPPPAPTAAQIREAQLAETLRQCRAAGYHAQQCVKRGCVATPYGIACKG